MRVPNREHACVGRGVEYAKSGVRRTTSSTTYHNLIIAHSPFSPASQILSQMHYPVYDVGFTFWKRVKTAWTITKKITDAFVSFSPACDGYVC